ncbi:MAG TPA: divalent metal cation transporter [Phenylobacterium sp.]|uniref:NRAMP family divalent metal transporter n=1 Tax=Phenylobacterium sp. TaxID=1871053 RepID=UPI002CA8F297|nr:divalent metal cation transporter [Phenylobacterium sp.]HSV02404.1 divalent metal cation transporter [Phenylobacterium sp.]
MAGLIEIVLGIMTAVGGFVDVSELTFAAQAGSRFGYSLLWVFALATVGIIVFGEMSGRVAAIAKQPVFCLMRQRLGVSLGLFTLIASIVVSLITCAAEIGGVAIVLKLMAGGAYLIWAALSVAALIVIVWVLPFEWIERLFGLLGLLMLAFAAATVALHPPWREVARGLVPQFPMHLPGGDRLAYGYFAVAITSAVLFPYETYFYSSGAIEDRWTPSKLPVNRLTTGVGFSLGSLLSMGILISAAVLFRPVHVDPREPATVALQVAVPFGRPGLLIALFGMLMAFSGAAVETCLAAAYSLAQFFGWPWGRYRKPAETPRFTLAWIAGFVIALALVLTNVPPLDLVEWSIVFSIVVLPLTYLPLLLIANDRKYMGRYVNGWVANGLGVAFYAIVVVAAVGAIPLYILTSGGQK